MKTKFRRILSVSIAIVAASVITSTVDAQSGSRQYSRSAQPVLSPAQQMQRVASNNKTKVGLEGYCPVCAVKMKKWELGKAEFSASYDGKTYFFPGAGPRQEFLRNPEKYVPALGGDCTVCYEKLGKRVPGSVRFATLQDKRLFLFPSAKELEAFNQQPDAFVDTDLAIDGQCIVCQVKANKSVQGNEQFTAVHNGFRYLFPSDRERQAFVRSPKQFISAAMENHTSGNARGHSMMKKPTMDQSSKAKQMSAQKMAKNQIEVRGEAACAGCEFGVTPVGNPDELGLAITTSQGKVYVIEDAHSRWPEIYKGRFGGTPLAVRGEVIKTDGNVTWIKPSLLTSL